WAGGTRGTLFATDPEAARNPEPVQSGLRRGPLISHTNPLRESRSPRHGVRVGNAGRHPRHLGPPLAQRFLIAQLYVVEGSAQVADFARQAILLKQHRFVAHVVSGSQ